jgi:hypothetical protein
LAWSGSLTMRAAYRPFLRDGVAAVHGVGKPGIKAPGTPEGVPRTAAITRRKHKKSACNNKRGAADAP